MRTRLPLLLIVVALGCEDKIPETTSTDSSPASARSPASLPPSPATAASAPTTKTPSASSAAPASNKVAQCNKLVVALDQEQTAVADAMSKIDGKDDAKVVGELADKLDQAKKDLDRLGLNEVTLKSLQREYVSAVEKTAKAARAQQAALNNVDPAALAAASAELKTGINAQSKLLAAVEGYCNAKP